MCLLPAVEYDFWNKMLDKKCGYLNVQNNSKELEAAEKEMREELKKFKNQACKAILFVNILYLVLAIGLKVKSDDLTKVPLTLRLSQVFIMIHSHRMKAPSQDPGEK